MTVALVVDMNSATQTKRIVIRSNTKGTVNRQMLRRLVAEGRMEARVDFAYDDMGGQTSGDWMPARLSTGYGDFVEGQVNLTADDFESVCGRAYITDDGRLRLRIHSNLIYVLRVRP